MTEKIFSTSSGDQSAYRLPSVSAMTEDIMGCKWSMTVLQLVRQGICRPGAMERQIEGLTSKVLNERLKKLTNYGILHRHAYPEIPPRVEYQLTEFGEKFVNILDAIATLDREIHASTTSESRIDFN